MIRRWLIFACALVLVAWLAGCASVTVTPIKSTDLETQGVRYYESEPYLLVTKDVPKTDTPPSTYTIKLVWLPNYNKGYAVKTTPGLGTANGSVTLADGWQLKVLGANVDSKIPETINAVTNLIQALGVSAIKVASGTEVRLEDIELKPGLYRLNFSEETGYVRGLERVF